MVRRFAVAGLDEAARRPGRRRGLAVGAIDETGQEKQGSATAGVKRHYLGCVGKVANGITTVHLAYVRERTGHALIGARQWIPHEQIDDPVKSLLMGLPLDLEFRTKGQLAIDICTEAFADGIRLDFVCGDEVYGSCTQLREFLEDRGQAYVLRVPSNFRLTLARGIKLTCAEAVTRLLKDTRRWEVRSAGQGFQGRALVCLGLARHRLPAPPPADPPPPQDRRAGLSLLLRARRPALTMARLIRAAGLRWPVEEEFRVRQGLLRPRPVPGPPLHRDRPPHRAGHGRPGHLRRHRRPAARPHRHPGAAPVTARPAAARRPRHDPADRPGDQAPARRPATGPTARPAEHWVDWRRRHQARSRWYHQRTRLARNTDNCPGQLANGGCRTRPDPMEAHRLCDRLNHATRVGRQPLTGADGSLT